ncbi:hypothetical protein THTE_0626 [Thermogutta terrifontis]|uniref:Uncharacterized protein n=1 Tax=Thermogutta terrifontis TaxID=1331910 RepID=A0A286RB91_9BACT|nr:hypothetical protein THTE_0626 [Thermogutta terrifontis]
MSYRMAIVRDHNPPYEKRPWLLQAMDIRPKPYPVRYHSLR